MKKQLVILGALAITAAAAVPALAFENEFHGMYRMRAIMSNFEIGGLGAAATAPLPANPPLLSTAERTYTIFEQRARLQYIAKANDDLKLVTHFEIDSTWGDAAYSNGRGMGAGLAADTVNLETKNVYLDFNIPSTPVNMKVGVQGWTDAYKGIFLSDDVGGAVATGKFGAATVTGAFFRTYDQGNGAVTDLGKKNVDVFVLDGKFALDKNTTLGAAYYFANNDVYKSSGQAVHTIGVNAATKLGIVDLDAFFLYQAGQELYVAANPKNLSAYAGQIAAKVNLGTVTVRAAGLYASGDDGQDANESSAYQNIFASGAAGAVAGSSTSSGVYYSSQMLLLLRNVYNMDSDNALVTSITNGQHGLIAGFLGADAKINDRFSVSGNLGYAMNAQKRGAAGAEQSQEIGTEVNVNLNYAVYTNLTATLQGAYCFLGNFKKANDLENPYLTGLMLNYVF